MSKPEPEFEMDDLVQELLSREREDDLGWRVVELAETTGLRKRVIREKLHELKRDGRLVRGIRRIEDLSGRMTPVPVYWLRADGD